jgi:hypothetical protein
VERIFLPYSSIFCEKTIHLMYAVNLNYTLYGCTYGNTVTNNGEFTLDDSKIASDKCIVRFP